MKKLCLVLGLAGLLSMPSIVFGEATWYGSFRGGVESAGGSSHMFSNGSRWGVRGSNEISEGLTANYRYEEALDLATASLSTGNRLSYVGLSGGFGTISIGRIWSASFNSVGAILDNSWVYGSSHTSYRVGPAVSYSNSAGAASMQVDLVMDKGNAAKSGVDSYEFGLSFDLGAATLAFAHRKQNHAAVTTTTTEFMPGTPGTPTTVTVDPGTPGTPTTVTVDPGTPGTPTTVTVDPGTPGMPGTPTTPTLVKVTPATPGDPGQAFKPAVEEDNPLATYQKLVNPQHVLPVDPAPADAAACRALGPNHLWVEGDDTSNSGNACYNTAIGPVHLENHPLKSARDAATGFDDGDAVNPLTARDAGNLPAGFTGVDTRFIHRSESDCTRTVTVAADGTRTSATNTNIWEPVSGMCYAAGTSFYYTTVPATPEEAARPKVDPEPIMVEVTQEGEPGTPNEPGTPTTVEVDPGTPGTPTTVEVDPGTPGTPTTVTVDPGTPSTPSTMVSTTTTTPAYDDTMNAVAVRFAAGSHSAAVGLVKTSDSRGMETSTTIANAGGPLSDGLSYNFMVRDTEGSGSNPWLIGLAKSLGGGSTVVLEHADNGDDNSTAVYLQVDF